MNTKKDTLLKVKGSISVYTSIYYMNGSPYRFPPFSWTFTGNPVIYFKGIIIPTKIVLGKQHSPYRQPFNLVGLSPRYKWITLHLGYRNLHFSPFTLSGHTFFGTGLELKPGKWKMAFIYGRMRKMIGEDPLLPYHMGATYRRTGYGGYIGHGNNDNNISFSFFRARDDTASLKIDTINSNNQLTPSDNLVAGIRSNQLIGKKTGKRKFIWEADLAASAYNRDLRSQPVPSTKLGLWTSFTALFQPTYSMRLATAGQTSLTVRGKNYATKIQYRRIEPGFVSMGAYYLQTDIERLTVEPSWKSCKKKLSINSALGIQRNNLDQQRHATTKRTVGSLNLSFNPSLKYALDVQLSNYGIIQRAGRNPLNDTTRMVQANKNISITNRYCSIREGKTESVILMLNYQQVSDLNAFTFALNDSRIYSLNLSYDKVLIPAGLTMNTAIQHTTFINFDGKNVLSGITGSMSRTLQANKLTYNNTVSIFSMAYFPDLTNIANVQRSKMVILNSGLQIKINRHHHWNGNLNCIFNQASSNQSFSEITAKLGYTYHF